MAEVEVRVFLSVVSSTGRLSVTTFHVLDRHHPAGPLFANHRFPPEVTDLGAWQPEDRRG